MRRKEKKQVEEFIGTLHSAHDEIKKQIENHNKELARKLLENCQDGAIQIGNLIETVEGEECPVIPMLEGYCELVYQIYEELGYEEAVRADKSFKVLHRQLTRIENSVRYDIKGRLEIVFLPYKASMWDSLESVWMAADADENCDAYVIPIPYYDRNPDGTLGEYHYEGDEFPDNVPIVHYDNYSLDKRRPDVIYIHNPYDSYNYVTSVDPRYYSKELRKFTDMLVYIPYYSTSGGMSEGQMTCPAYYYADYIITQAEKYRKFFDPDLPNSKFKPFGSPKFDRIVRICNHPPKPPAEWAEKMKGKRVYFYNTSLNGMLADTDSFLKKMKYVFECFEGREDVCLLWRPHPLMESTLESMRAQYKPFYEWLKGYFIENGLGIYDDTPDIANTIALCDAYIGDGATSVTSLFGIVGKPLFILDNHIHSVPGEDDWRGKAIPGFNFYGDDNWMIPQGNKLYFSENGDYRYKYFCDLSEYAYGYYYSQVITIGEKHYVCPANARDILVLGKSGVEKRIEVEQCMEQAGAFGGAISWEKYLFLIPNNYPAVVRYDTEKDEICYYSQHLDVFQRNVGGETRVGGVCVQTMMVCVQDGVLYLASPEDNYILAIQAESGEEKVLAVEVNHRCGCMGMVSDGMDIWLLPYDGYVITRWNPRNGMIQEYMDYPEGLFCTHMIHKYQCSERPFSVPAFCGDYVYFPPQWANMFVCLNKKTGEMKEWKPPMEIPKGWQNGYYLCWIKSCFVRPVGKCSENEIHLFSLFDRKLYSINMETEEYKDVPIGLEKDELERHEAGFQENSEWLQYACEENAFNSLLSLLNGSISGNGFEKEKQVRAFGEIAANNDGTCGEKTHQFVCRQLM